MASETFKHGSPGDKRDGGFTLVELMIVIAILGILVMAAVPAIGPPLEEARLGSSAAQVTSALEYAQLRAISSGRRTRVVADPATDRILLQQIAVSSNILSGGILLPEAEVESVTLEPIEDPMNRGLDYVIDLRNGSNPVDLVSADFGGATSIMFFALGTASSPGDIVLQTGNLSRRIRVAAATGKVTVE